MTIDLLLSLLRRFWWLVPAAGILLALAYQHHEIGSLRASKAAQEATIGADQVQIAQLRADVAAQNAGIAKIKADAKAEAAQAVRQEQAREQAAQQVAALYARQARQIAVAPVPSGCDQAVAWAATAAGKLSGGWK